MDSTIKDAILKQYPKCIAELIAIYGPSLGRMLMKEINAVKDQASAGETDAALALMRAKMTGDELVAEKEAVVELKRLIATDAADNKELLNKIIIKVVEGSLMFLLTGGLL